MNKNKPFEIDCGTIVLREFQECHAEMIYKIAQEPEITHFLPDWVSTLEDRTKWMIQDDIPENQEFLRLLPAISDGNTPPLRLAIILKETQEMIGWIATGFKDEIEAPNREIGYAISNHHTGNGYASLACIALMNFLFNETDTAELIAVAQKTNVGSNRVILKSGYKHVGTVILYGKEYDSYRIKKDEWTSTKY